MKKKPIITILVVVFVLSVFSIWSMTSRLNYERITSFQNEINTNHDLAKEGFLQNKNDLICSAQGDVRPPAWDEEEKTASGS